MIDLIISSIGFGIVSAAILSLGAVSFTLQYGVSNILNLAIAGIMGVAEYVALVLNDTGLTIWLALVIAAIAGAASSYAMNRFIYIPFLRRRMKSFQMVIITLSLWTMIEYGLLAIVGNTSSSYRQPASVTYSLGPLHFTGTQIVFIVIAIVAVGALEAFLRLTLFGKAIRGAATNAPLARASGIDVGRVIDITWLISGAFAGVAGVVLAMNISSFTYTTSSDFLALLLAAAILGGVGRPAGAVLGALIVGVVSSVSAALWNPSEEYVAAFVLLALVLLVRPRGLLPETVQRKDVLL